MAGPRVNLAVTKDGGSYNKLKRPADYLGSAPPTTHSSERKRERDIAPEEGKAESKRAKTNHGSLKSENSEGRSRTGGPVAECGMRESIPLGTDAFDDEELRPDDDALAYLLGVRSEASAIPRLLGGAKEAYNNSDERAICQDGTWIALDEDYDDDYDEEDDEQPSPQEEYCKQLLKRFRALRNTFAEMEAQGLPQGKGADKDQSHASPPKSRHDWYCTIEREYPTPAQVLQMDERAVLKGLEYCAHAIGRFDTISSQKSCWIWTLLALLGENGTLNHWKMAQVRDLGCRAGQLGAELRKGAVTRSRAIAEDEDLGGESDVENDEYSASQEVEEEEEEEYEADEDDAEVGASSHELEQPEAYNKTQNEGSLEVSGDVQTQVPSKEAADDSEAEMSMSEDEKHGNSDDEAVDLEKARARLLAQLGDRLVQPGIHTAEQSSDSKGSHLSSGQISHDVTQEQGQSATRSFPSRVEAERQRQLMREQERRKEAEKEKIRVQQRDAKAVSKDLSHSMTAVDMNTRVTIDMILTVVAECYGQKDLLKFREVW